VTTKTW